MGAKAVFVAVLVAIALVFVGCGSSGGGGTTGGTSAAATAGEGSDTSSQGGTGASGSEGKAPSGPLTRKQFIKEGDAICGQVPTEYAEKLKALEAEAKKKGQKPTKPEISVKAAVPPLYVAVESFEALSPPSGDQRKAEAFVKALEKAAKGLEAKPESPLTGPKSPFSEFQKLTSEYGFKICSKL